MIHSAICLRATCFENKVDRFYTLSWGEDLFNTPTLEINFGRFGASGQSKTFSFSCTKDIERKITFVLKKRLNSQKRIGTSYRVVSHHLEEMNSDKLKELVQKFS